MARPVPPDEVRCIATTKAGTQCPQWRRQHPETGQDLETCVAHAPDEVRAMFGFGNVPGKNLTGGGRRKVPSVRELVLQKLEVEADALTARLLDIAYSGARTVVVPGGRDSEGYTEEVPDEALQLKAVQYTMDQIIGKPMNRAEISGPDSGAAPVDLTPTEVEAQKIIDAMKQADL